MARLSLLQILMVLLLLLDMAFGSPSVSLLPTGRNRFEGRVMVDSGNGTQSPVCSLGVTHHEADMLCSMIGHSGATKIYPRAQCFGDSDKYDGSMLSVTKCDNWTDIASCFQLANCGCCRSRNQLALRCYGEGAIELENNSEKTMDGNKDIVMDGLVTVYANGSWWSINGKSSGSIQSYICGSVGLVNCENCTILSEGDHLRYGKSNVAHVAPYAWNCPHSGSGTLDNCSRRKLRPSPYPILLTMKCLLPAGNGTNYTLCHDNQAKEIESSTEKCEQNCWDQTTTASETSAPSPSKQGRKSRDVDRIRITLPIGLCLGLIAVGIIVAVIRVRKRKLRKFSSTANYHDNKDDATAKLQISSD